jgi:ABC-type multidrug transport system fused ATPase/permease subunit
VLVVAAPLPVAAAAGNPCRLHFGNRSLKHDNATCWPRFNQPKLLFSCSAAFSLCLQSLPPCLLQLQLAIPAGCLTAIVGEVGSGKSSLLSALLGELELVSGFAKLPHQRQQQQQQRQQHTARIGYVGQAPWVMRGSVRDNVLMGQTYDAEFMGEVGACYNMLKPNCS